MTIDTQTVTLLAILVSVLGSAWKINDRVTGLEVRLTERLARVEGRLDTLESVIVQVFTKSEASQ